MRRGGAADGTLDVALDRFAGEELALPITFRNTATPAPPPVPAKLRRVWGCGSSAVAASTGNGAYFLDRVAAGLWRLQLYPSVMACADPHTGHPGVKTVVLADVPTLTVRLPDLGETFTAFRTDDGSRAGRATVGTLALPPGDYVLARAAAPTAERLSAARRFDLPRYWAPPPHPVDPKRRAWPLSRAEQLAEARARATTPEAWNFLDEPFAWKRRVTAANFIETNTRWRRFGVKGWVFAELFPTNRHGRVRTVVIRGRSTTGSPEPVEIVFHDAANRPWGTVITLPPEGGEVRLALDAFRYFAHHTKVPFEPGWRLEPGEIREMRVCIGRWLYPDKIDRPHGVAFDFVGVSFSSPITSKCSRSARGVSSERPSRVNRLLS